MRNTRYFFHEGLSNMRCHSFMTFAAVGITVACMLIMGTFTLVAVNINVNLKDLEESNEIVAFVDEKYTNPENLQLTLESIPNVIYVQYITKEEATNNFLEQYPDEDIFQDVTPELFRDRYALRISSLQLLSDTIAQVKEVEGVADVNAYEEVASGFITLRNVATALCVAMITTLFVVSMFIMSNTIRLTTFDRKEEIAIMRMVGATNNFIRGPFIYEGLIMGLSSASIAFFLQWALYIALAGGVNNTDTLQLFRIIPFTNLWGFVALAFILTGILVGIGGSLAAIRKFLKV